MLLPMKRLFPIIAAMMFAACAPQAAFFQVDVRDMQGRDLDISGKQAAVFSLVGNGGADSIRGGNAALALAKKLGQDRGLENPLPVFSLPLLDFAGFGASGYDKDYLHELMLTTGADLQIFVNSLKFGHYDVQDTGGYIGEYGERIVVLPYSVEMDIYDALNDTLLVQQAAEDTVYMAVLAQASRKDYGPLVAAKLPDVCRMVGESLGSTLTRQWNRQERMLVNYEGNEKWERPLAMALDFKWKEAVELWMPLVSDPNSRKASYAAYNIAVACDMLGQKKLAADWAAFSVSKFKFRENMQLQKQLQKMN